MREVTLSTQEWLLSPEDPGVRYLAMRTLGSLREGDESLSIARALAHTQGPIATILDAMHPEGYWVQPGAGYYPKYQGSAWSLITLAQLGASVDEDQRIETACKYFLDSSFAAGGQIGANGAPSGTADCLQGNTIFSLRALGYNDLRLDQAYEWMARTVTGEGLAPKEDRKAEKRYYAGKCGPLFACGSNNNLPCAWGGVKVLLAFSQIPLEQRTPLIQRAIQAGVDFFLSVDPATAAYPSGYSSKPSGNWWKFGFPVFYITDLLQLLEALVRLGYGADPRLANAFQIVRNKQNERGRWSLDYDYTGKTWLDYGVKKQENKWVTLRALSVLGQD